MLKPIALANAFTTVALGLYVLCRIISLVAPDFLFSVAKSWFHTFSVDSIKGTASMDIGTFLFGAISLAVLTWITAYTGTLLYNKWSK
ncbi:MAG: DUF5676 family membrane protein [Patescibacteria group bacterium]